MVSFVKEPAPVSLGIGNQLMLRCEASGKLLPPTLLKPRDQVRLTSGPFADFVGTIEANARPPPAASVGADGDHGRIEPRGSCR